MSYRLDKFTVDASQIEITPAGGLRFPARIARTGIQLYLGENGETIREYRPPDEVFSKESLDSWKGAPLTNLHPRAGVNPWNYTELTKGHVSEIAKEDIYVGSKVSVDDGAMIDQIKAGKRIELSGGYSVDIDPTPGVTSDGERYDRIQRNIRGNHVGLGPPGWGRAGSEVALRLDGNDNVVLKVGEKAKMKHLIQICGLTFQLDGDDNFADAWKKHTEEVDQIKADRDEINVKLAEIKVDHEAAKVDLEAAKDPGVLAAAVKARTEIETSARKLDAETDFSELSDRDVMITALNDEDYKVDGISDDEIRGAFRAAIKLSKPTKADALDKAMQTIKTNRSDSGESSINQVEAEFNQRRRDAWKQPLAVSSQR